MNNADTAAAVQTASGMEETPLAITDPLYARDLLIQLYKRCSTVPERLLATLQQDEELLSFLLSPEPLEPISFQPLTEREEHILSSGSVNSDVVNKRMNHQQQQGQRTRGTGDRRGRGRGQGRHPHPNHGGRMRRAGESDERILDAAAVPDDLWDLPNRHDAHAAGSFTNGSYLGGSEQDPIAAGRAAYTGVHSSIGRRQPEVWTNSAAPAAPPQEPLWVYKDPQGKQQGPFTATEMLQWYEAGYFPDTLQIKQTTQDRFEELALYMDRFGGQVQFHVPVPVRHRPVQQEFRAPQVPAAAAWGLPQWNDSGVAPLGELQSIPILTKSSPTPDEAVLAPLLQNMQLAHSNVPPSNANNRIPLVQAQAGVRKPPVVEVPAERAPVVELPVKKKEPPPITNPWSKPAAAAPQRPAVAAVVETKVEEKPVVRKEQAAAPRRYADLASGATANTTTTPAVKPTFVEPRNVNAVAAQASTKPASKTTKNASAVAVPSGKQQPTAGATLSDQDPVDFSHMTKRPSDNVLAWCRQALAPLSGRVDLSAFVDMLSTLTHPEMINDIVHDAIGPDFQLVNPYKFMSEYLHRLKEDAGLRGRVVVPPTPEQSAYYQSLNSAKSSVAKTENMSEFGDKGFQVVKKKKAKKGNGGSTGPRDIAAPVGVNGKQVVGAAPRP